MIMMSGRPWLESFNWHNAKRQLDKIGNLHPEIPDSQMKKYVNAKAEGMMSYDPVLKTKN